MIDRHVDDIVDSLTAKGVITELDVFYRCILKETRKDLDAEVSPDKVRARLKCHVDQGRLMVLYPVGVNPTSAARSETYYLKID